MSPRTNDPVAAGVPAHPTATAGRAERAAQGKARRMIAPLESQGAIDLAADRDPVGVLMTQASTRVQELLPIRYGRMSLTSFTFFRGAAAPMAADLARTPNSGITVQLCGDAHLANFGAYASPERRLVFDLNDFDETHPGPFEWDVKRFAASLVVAGRDNGFREKDCRKVALAAVRHYRESVLAFAAQPVMQVWYSQRDIETDIAELKKSVRRGQVRMDRTVVESTASLLAKARTRDSTQAVRKLTAMTPDGRRIVADPPLVVPIQDTFAPELAAAVTRLLTGMVRRYKATLRSDRRHLLDQFRLVDIAHKVVGVGSVGAQAWIMLLENADGDDTLVLQAKQAQQSVIAPYVKKVKYAQHGQRVVAGQLAMQAASDIFLGWVRAPDVLGVDLDYYIRQLRDWKASAEIDTLDPTGMELYGRLCGWTLARAHARSGDRIALAGYLGRSAKFENAIADFAQAYADRTTLDRAALAADITAGRVPAHTGI